MKKTIQIIINLFVFLNVAYIVAGFFIPFRRPEPTGWINFRYFTILSNVFGALTSLAVVVMQLLKRKTGRKLFVLRYMSTTSLAITLLTVVFFLGPIFGYRFMFTGDNLYLHLINPLIVLTSFIVLEEGRMKSSDWLKGTVPLLCYAPVYLTNVIIIRKWPDFYGFNMVGKWYLSLIAMLIAAMLISFMIKVLHDMVRKNASAD